MRPSTILHGCATVAIFASLVACGGGSSTSVPFVSPTAATKPGQAMNVVLSIVIPGAATKPSLRGRDYVSPSTEGMIVTAGNSASTSSYGYSIAPTGTNCTKLASGESQCTVSIAANVGSETFSVWLYDAAEGPSDGTPAAAPAKASGKLLSQGLGVTQTIVSGTSNIVKITLDPVVASVTSTNGPQIVSVSGTSGVGGSTSATPPPIFDGVDADSNTIDQYSTSANGVYANPIALTVGDGGKGDTIVTPTSFANSATDAIVATFNGATAVQPTNTTATPYDAIVTATDSLTSGGYGNTSSFPTSTATVTVAPLFAYAATYRLDITNSSTSTTVLYGLVAATPANSKYAIATTPTSGSNDCSNFTLTAVTSNLTAHEVVGYTVTATAVSNSGTSCTFALSDGTGTITDSTPFVATGPLYHPAANTDSFSFAGTEVITYARPNQSPTPEPTTTAAYNVTQSVSVTNPASFAGNSKAVDFHTSETDSETTGPSTSPLQNTIDTYYAFNNTISAGNFYTLGFTSLDNNGYAVTQTYAGAGSLTDMLPEASGQSWTNSPAQTITTSNSSNITSTQTFAANGTYSESINYPSNGANAMGTPNPGATALLTQNIDGSAVYESDRNGNARTGDVTYSFATPNASDDIVITANAPPLVTASPGATPTVTSVTVTDWIPTGYLGKNLFTETDADSGSATLPSTCNVPASFGTSGNKITQTRNRIDTIQGEVETMTFTYYDIVNVGPVCTTLHDVLDSYYDYSGQAYPNYWGSGSVQQITTVDENLSLTAQQLESIARRSDARAAIARAFAMHSSALPSRVAAFHAKRRLNILQRMQARALHDVAKPSQQEGLF